MANPSPEEAGGLVYSKFYLFNLNSLNNSLSHVDSGVVRNAGGELLGGRADRAGQPLLGVEGLGQGMDSAPLLQSECPAVFPVRVQRRSSSVCGGGGEAALGKGQKPAP